MTREEALRAFADAGFAVIPLCSLDRAHEHFGRECRTPGKVPARQGWQITAVGQYDKEKLAGRNYGVVLRADTLVIDVDPRHFKPGDRPLARLAEKVGGLEGTFTVRTGGGGLHIYFFKPPNLNIRGSLADYEGIDFRTAGTHTVGPGSGHVSGHEYAVAFGTPLEIREAPPALLALLSRPAVLNTKGTGVYADNEGARARFAEYLKGPAPTTGTYKVACYARDLALPPETAAALMFEHWAPRREVPRTFEEVRTKVQHAYSYARGPVGGEAPAAEFAPVELGTGEPEQLRWEIGRNGGLKKTFKNLLMLFKYAPSRLTRVYGYNEFTGRVEYMRPAPWHNSRMPAHRGVTDNDLKLLKAHLARNHALEMPVTVIEEAVTVAAYDARFHPVREYLESLKWDGVGRVDTWLHDFAGADNTEYVRAVGRRVLCAAVTRVMRPGIKFDHVLVLEGRQGIGKSSLCHILAGEWGADFPVDPHNKDTIQLMQGRWIIELAELEVTKRADLQALRAFITRTRDEARLAYGRTVATFPRQSIFIGSINPGADGTYLKDDENRRWWPVSCGNRPFDLPGLRAARNQLFAEAYHLCATSKQALHMDTTELAELARDEAQRRHGEHPWTSAISLWLDSAQRTRETYRDFVEAREVYAGALGGTDRAFDRYVVGAITDIMLKLGWERRRRYVRRRNVWGFAPATRAESVLGDLA